MSHSNGQRIAFLLLVLIFQTLASCPNHCNANGKCNKYGRYENIS